MNQKPQQGPKGETGIAIGCRSGQHGAQAGAGRDTEAIRHDAHAEDEQGEAAQHGEDQKE